MTEETQQATETAAVTQPPDQNVASNSENTKVKEVKKEKCRPMTKVVIRRLPPTMTQEQFLEQVSPLPDYDYLYFAKADLSLGQYAFCRAYIDFVNQQDIFEFREKFDNYVFVDAKGVEYPAVVEFAPFQRVPKKRIGKKKDLKCGTIETDPYYISFLENLKNQQAESATGQPKTEYSFQPSDHTAKKVTTTPLLDYLKQRKQEKQRLRDEKREEKRRRDLERKRSKDEPMVSKVLKNLEEKDKDREYNKDNKENKEDRDRIIQKDFKNKNKKDEKYRDKFGKDRDSKVPNKNYRDRDEKIKDKDYKMNKKQEDKKFYNKKDDRELHRKDNYNKEDSKYKDRKLEEKRGKSYEKMRLEKKKQSETSKKENNDQALEDHDEGHEGVDYQVEEDDEKITENEKDDGQDISELNDDSSQVAGDESSDHSIVKKKPGPLDKYRVNTEFPSSKNDESKTVLPKKSPTHNRITKRRSSLESGGESGAGAKNSGVSGTSSGHSSDSRDLENACLRRHKSLDGGSDSDLRKEEDGDDKEKDKKDPRTERRIRNKDRPAMEIYRPGMGRFSKQRIEREKGSEEKTSPPSQSPTPTSSGNSFKSGKPSISEVRTMTFKRSVSRDA